MSGLPQRRMRRCEPGDHDRLARADHDPPCGAAHARLRPKEQHIPQTSNRSRNRTSFLSKSKALRGFLPRATRPGPRGRRRSADFYLVSRKPCGLSPQGYSPWTSRAQEKCRLLSSESKALRGFLPRATRPGPRGLTTSGSLPTMAHPREDGGCSARVLTTLNAAGGSAGCRLHQERSSCDLIRRELGFRLLKKT